MTSYYVYYRIDPARLDEVRAAVAGLMREVEQATGVRGRWLRRRDEATTYMEVYEGVADETSFEAIMARAAASLRQERHVERFVPCA